MMILLGDIAHLRSGDKGDTAQISVIVYDAADFPLLVREVTAERVVAHLSRLIVRRAIRYELPRLGALNFVLEGALGGGVTRSLALDTHGKTLAAQLLDLRLDDAAETRR
jgi:hypothetical protein